MPFNDYEYFCICEEGDDRLTYLVLVEKDFDRSVGFEMLDHLKSYFVDPSLENIGQQKEFCWNENYQKYLKKSHEKFSELTKLQKVQIGIGKLNNDMHQNLQSLMENDTKLDELNHKAEQMVFLGEAIAMVSNKVKNLNLQEDSDSNCRDTLTTKNID